MICHKNSIFGLYTENGYRNNAKMARTGRYGGSERCQGTVIIENGDWYGKCRLLDVFSMERTGAPLPTAGSGVPGVNLPSIPIHCKCMGWWIVLKSVARGSKCPIQLCLPIDVGRKFSWLMKTCSEFPLHLRDAANELFKLYMFTCKRQAWDFSRQSTSISSIIYQHFPSRNLCDLTWSCC